MARGKGIGDTGQRGDGRFLLKDGRGVGKELSNSNRGKLMKHE